LKKNWDDISFTYQNKNTALEFAIQRVLPQQSAATIKPTGLSEQRRVRQIASREFLIGWIKYFNSFTHKIIENFILVKALKIQFFTIFHVKNFMSIFEIEMGTSTKFLSFKK
jgi:hypothetical protein